MAEETRSGKYSSIAESGLSIALNLATVASPPQTTNPATLLTIFTRAGVVPFT